MPQTAFRDISRLKLPFPLIFELTKGKAGPRSKKKKQKRQLCGVYEFSAPQDQIFMPHWMMEGMRVKEGGKVSLMSVFELPKGVNMVLQPHKISFLDLAAAFGTKELLEQAMRNYSALTAGEPAHAAMRSALLTTGPALVMTSLALGLGFLTLRLAAWATIASFGALVAFSILAALVSTLVVLPAGLELTSRQAGRETGSEANEIGRHKTMARG